MLPETQTIKNEITSTGSEVRIAVMANNIERIQGDITEIKNLIKDLNKNFVVINDFVPVRNIVYGASGAILLAVLGTIVNYFFNRH